MSSDGAPGAIHETTDLALLPLNLELPPVARTAGVAADVFHVQPQGRGVVARRVGDALLDAVGGSERTRHGRRLCIAAAPPKLEIVVRVLRRGQRRSERQRDVGEDGEVGLLEIELHPLRSRAVEYE